MLIARATEGRTAIGSRSSVGRLDVKLTVLRADAGARAAADTKARMIDNHHQSLDPIIVCVITGTYNFA
jgi:hypothetical protein